jgi:hypothetical protein
MGGDIQVSSQLGIGSVFTITLKGGTVSPPSPTSTSSSTTPAISPVSDLRTLADPYNCNVDVLVVEDNAINQRLLCRMLSREGFKCRAAFNGQEALNILREEDDLFKKLHCIFMDLNMVRKFALVSHTHTLSLFLQLSTLFPLVALFGRIYVYITYMDIDIDF